MGWQIEPIFPNSKYTNTQQRKKIAKPKDALL
jgi:hypothetical protein